MKLTVISKVYHKQKKTVLKIQATYSFQKPKTTKTSIVQSPPYNSVGLSTHSK